MAGEGSSSGGLGGDSGMGGMGGEDSSSGGTGGYVNTHIQSAITKQLAPNDPWTAAYIEVGTLSAHPVLLLNPQVTAPTGWHVASFEEELEDRDCPTNQTMPRCRQYFLLTLYSDGACVFDGDYDMNWDVACAPGGDCERIDPELTTYSLTLTPTSNNFCDEEWVSAYDPFLPNGGYVNPSLGDGPVTLRFFTTLDLPYELSPGSVTTPEGISLVSFTEDQAQRQCETEDFPNACRQWWNVVVDPGENCSVFGSYNAKWNVDCAPGGSCNPDITAYTGNVAITETRNLCD